jgi:hypothetical protein
MTKEFGVNPIAISHVLQRLAVSCALMFSIYGAACAEPVFSFDSTPGKLPKTVVPIHYAIELKPDIASLALSGVEIVDIEVHAPTARLTLNAVNTTFAAVTVDGDTARADVALDAGAETATFTFAQPLGVGAHRLRIEFAAQINKFDRGSSSSIIRPITA